MGPFFCPPAFAVEFFPLFSLLGRDGGAFSSAMSYESDRVDKVVLGHYEPIEYSSGPAPPPRRILSWWLVPLTPYGHSPMKKAYFLPLFSF